MSSRDLGWRAEAEGALDLLAAAGYPFTVEDLRGEVGPGPSPGSLGAVIAAARRDGRIRAVGVDRATHVAGHGRLIWKWIGARYDDGVPP
jgi:hypothetical protein